MHRNDSYMTRIEINVTHRKDVNPLLERDVSHNGGVMAPAPWPFKGNQLSGLKYSPVTQMHESRHVGMSHVTQLGIRPVTHWNE